MEHFSFIIEKLKERVKKSSYGKNLYQFDILKSQKQVADEVWQLLYPEPAADDRTRFRNHPPPSYNAAIKITSKKAANLATELECEARKLKELLQRLEF